MKIILAGGTGFIGKELSQSLVKQEHEVVILSRNPAKSIPGCRVVNWDLFRVGGNWEKEINGADIVINLVGEPIADKRWTPEQKQELRESRLRSVKAIYRAIEKASRRPKTLLNASAIGYYGPRGDEILDENSPPGTGFLAELCREWEEEVMKTEALSVRTVRLRIGIVLEKKGGALSKMLLPFQLGLGGPIGSGVQWMSWIHRTDLVNLIIFLIQNQEASGAINATAMNPAKMKDFAKTLGKVLKRPAVFPVPAFVLGILLGELSEMLLTGQCVLPQRAIQLGFSYQYPTLESALKNILDRYPR